MSLTIGVLLQLVTVSGMSAYFGKDACGDARWVSYKKKLSGAFHRFEKGELMESLKESSLLITGKMLDPLTAFDCAAALASTTNLISEIYQVAGAPTKALRFAQLTSIFAAFEFQMKGEQWIDTSGWRLKWADTIASVIKTMSTFQGINPFGYSIDPLRNHSASEIPKTDIAIVSVCDYNPESTPLTFLSKENKEGYSHMHGYDLYFFEEAPMYSDIFTALGGISETRPKAWSKIDAMISVVSTGNYDWVMWMDCDSFFMDRDRPLTNVIMDAIASRGGDVEDIQASQWSKEAVVRLARWEPSSSVATVTDLIRLYDEHAVKIISEIIPTSPDTLLVDRKDVLLIASEDGLMLNTGIFFVRSDPSSLWFLQKVRQMTFEENPITFHSWWEQTAMVYLAYKGMLLPSLNTLSDFDDLENVGYPPSFALLRQKSINGYPPIVSAMLKTHTAFEEGDFIVSFSGCKVYSSDAVCNMLFMTYFCNNPEMCISNLGDEMISKYVQG